jgi:hypothetical protein
VSAANRALTIDAMATASGMNLRIRAVSFRAELG